jgi:hypothetical protein
MAYMFESSKFNQDISNWNVNNVQSMIFMFSSAEFNQDISNWNINKECNTMRMFYHGSINNEYKPKGIINEAFDFDNVDNKKKVLNVFSQFFNILEKPYKSITDEDKEYI